MADDFKPILLDVPDQIETERLLLRIIHPGDGVIINPVVNAFKDDFCPWLPWACGGQTLEESETFARTMYANFILRQDFIFVMLEKATGDFCGMVGIHAKNWKLPSFEIGYWLATNKVGNGYMTQSVELLTQYGFEHLRARRIIIRCDVENKRSAAVAERCGYTREGIIYNEMRDHAGTLRDTYLYSLTRPDEE